MDIKDKVKSLGGCVAVARLLGLPRKSGAQTVCNWVRRGRVPYRVLLNNPGIFDTATTQGSRDA